MCQIVISHKNLSYQEMNKLEGNNTDGAGVAWFDNGKHRYVKGLKLLEAFDVQKSIKTMPFVVHFRLASAGGKHDVLCHPFPITDDCKQLNYKKGVTGRPLLFHNGHIISMSVLGMIIKNVFNVNVDDKNEHWSDTKMMAFLLAKKYIKYKNLMDEYSYQKFAIMRDNHIYYYGEWQKQETEKIIVSSFYTRPAYNYESRQASFWQEDAMLHNNLALRNKQKK